MSMEFVINQNMLCRLEGFKDPWETSVFRGRQMNPSDTLESQGIVAGCSITSVRRVLVPEGMPGQFLHSSYSACDHTA